MQGIELVPHPSDPGSLANLRKHSGRSGQAWNWKEAADYLGKSKNIPQSVAPFCRKEGSGWNVPELVVARLDSGVPPVEDWKIVESGLAPLGRTYTVEDACWHLCCTAEELAGVRRFNGLYWHDDLVAFVLAPERKGTIVVLRTIGNDDEPTWVPGDALRGWRVLWPGELAWKLGSHDRSPSEDREYQKELEKLRTNPEHLVAPPIDLG